MTAPKDDILKTLDLQGRGYVVLGSGQGIGAATCRALAGLGGRLLCVDNDPARGEAIAREVGGDSITAEVTKRADMERVFAEADRLFGAAFSGIVDIVGMAKNGPLAEVDDATWDAQFDIVLRHAFLTIQIGGERLAKRGGGAIAFVGSLSGLRSIPGQAIYGTAKAALHHLVETAAHEFGPSGVRINAVAPAFVRTPRLLRFSQTFWDNVAAALPLRRSAEPEDIAKTLVFLVSDMSTCMTGAVVPCDGGAAQVAVAPNLMNR
jgi:NAD(P)-dependent dehydrogenase (short-subunit alcohol dehydrogenase family)